MNVKRFREVLARFPDEMPVAFRTLDWDYRFNTGEPFIEEIDAESDDDPTRTVSVKAMILCSDEYTD